MKPNIMHWRQKTRGIITRKTRRLARIYSVLCDLVLYKAQDAREARSTSPRIRSVHKGDRLAPPNGKIVLYAHHSAHDTVHAMVFMQLSQYVDSGYTVIFSTTARSLDPLSLKKLQSLNAYIVQRRSFGRDFGAWKDSIPFMRACGLSPSHLLLTNDSILGPFSPLGKTLRRMEHYGNGLVGLTESARPYHLQSYCLLAAGPEAVSDAMCFLENLPLSHNPWLMVRRGEYGLTRYMKERGQPIHCLYPEPELRVLMARSGSPAPARGFNPTHHGWRVLVEELGFPFIKRDLIARNVHALDDVPHWATILQKKDRAMTHMVHSYIAREVFKKTGPPR